MADFPLSYDADRQMIAVDGPGGASVMLAVMLKAKFGEAFDPEILFHGPLAKLMTELRAASLIPGVAAEAPFSQEQLVLIATEIAAKSAEIGWWTWLPGDRIAYLQDTVAAPHRLSDDQVETILLEVDVELDRYREIVRAAALT